MPLNFSAADSSRATRGLLAERRDRAALRDATDALPLLVDVDTAAAMLDVSPRTIWRLAETGELTPVRIGRATRWVTGDVLAFVERLRERRARPKQSKQRCRKRAAAPATVNTTSK